MPETTQAVPSLSHARRCVPVRANKQTKKLSNRVPETTTQAVPSLSRARRCVAVRANKQKKNFKTACQKKQPHRPFLRSHVRARTCVAVRGEKKKRTNTLKPLARNNHTGRSFALACPYVRGRTCKPKKK